MALTKQFLTGTGDGTGLKIAATTLGGANTVHTVPASSKDKVFLSATNNDTVLRTLTIVWGAATAVDDEITFSLQPKAGLVPLLALTLDAAKVVKAYAEATNVIVVHGEANRIA